jgi:hypothetical protein
VQAPLGDRADRAERRLHIAHGRVAEVQAARLLRG